MAAIELAWARSARRAAREAGGARAVLYSSTTAALLAPRPGAIRFDAPAAGNRPGAPRALAAAGRAAAAARGVAARAVERGRAGRGAARRTPTRSSCRCPSSRAERPPSGTSPRSPTAPTPRRRASTACSRRGPPRAARARSSWSRGSTRRAAARTRAARSGRAAGDPLAGVRFAGALPARSTARSCAARGCSSPRRAGRTTGSRSSRRSPTAAALATTAAPGPYAALPVARALDPRLVGEDLAGALRIALDDPAPGYAERARTALAPWAPGEVDRVVAEVLLPRLLG